MSLNNPIEQGDSFVKARKLIKNEKGSATIEFIAMVPLVLLIMMILWQFLIAGYAVIITQSAANEAAKIYSLSENKSEAENAAKRVIESAGDNLTFKSIDNPVSYNGDSKNFKMNLNVEMNVIFIPKDIVGKIPPITFSKSISGRVME
jgi:hypothetical protein